MVFDVTVGKNQKTQGTLHGESGLIANYDCEGGSTPSVLDCKMTDGSKSSKITVLHDLSQIKARIYDADHFTQINWPVNWDPLPGPKGYVESICETRHEIIQKTLKPMICKSADSKIQVQTSYTQGFSFFKIRGFTNSAGSSPNMDCVGQMFSPASYFLTGHQSSCPYSFAISNGNQLSLSCADQAPCSKKDLTCTPE